jgi:dTDP-4-amino-4,6-dideoxygalactose transaminase
MIPSAGTPIKIADILNSIVHSSDLEDSIKKMLVTRHAFAVNSGTTALYIILRALKRLSDKDEIILPAYTAPSLTLPIKKAGLKYRLVDISPHTFNMDVEKTAAAVTDRTLAVLCVHLFGLPVELGNGTRKTDAFVIEDAASSFGTRKGIRFTGTFGDIGFISFNRGKNLSTVTGGIIVTDNEKFAELIRNEIEKLPSHSFSGKTRLFLKSIALSYAVRPWFYTLFQKAISKFKYTSLHEDFDSFQYVMFLGSLGCSLLKRAEDIFNDRKEKGRILHDAFSNIKGIRCPEIPEGWSVVFNQFPVIVENPEKRMRVFEEINRLGIESTILYDKPIHKIYQYNGGSFPHAEYISERLVLIPVHHYVKNETLYKVVETVEGVVRS